MIIRLEKYNLKDILPFLYPSWKKRTHKILSGKCLLYTQNAACRPIQALLLYTFTISGWHSNELPVQWKHWSIQGLSNELGQGMHCVMLSIITSYIHVTWKAYSVKCTLLTMVVNQRKGNDLIPPSLRFQTESNTTLNKQTNKEELINVQTNQIY